LRHILFLLFPFFLLAQSSFITPIEYASQLYKNPRGIGCNNCHGDNGEGKLIARYKHKGEDRTFRGPEIINIKYNEFYKALSRRKNGMPRYFLTDKEIQALYLHLHQNETKEKTDAK